MRRVLSRVYSASWSGPVWSGLSSRLDRRWLKWETLTDHLLHCNERLATTRGREP